MPTRKERRAAVAAAEALEPIKPFFMRLLGAPVVRKMLGIPFGKMGQCASPAKSARHARYPVSPVAAINAWAHMAGYLHESVSVVDASGRGLGLVAAKVRERHVCSSLNPPHPAATSAPTAHAALRALTLAA